MRVPCEDSFMELRKITSTLVECFLEEGRFNEETTIRCAFPELGGFYLAHLAGTC